MAHSGYESRGCRPCVDRTLPVPAGGRDGTARVWRVPSKGLDRGSKGEAGKGGEEDPPVVSRVLEHGASSSSSLSLQVLEGP